MISTNIPMDVQFVIAHFRYPDSLYVAHYTPSGQKCSVASCIVVGVRNIHSHGYVTVFSVSQ